MSQQLEAGGLKILVWGIAIPYHHWIRHDYLQATIEEMMEEELRDLHRCLMDNVQVENFCLVGLLVIHGVPQRGLVADQIIPVAPIVGDMFATMKRIGLRSRLQGAKFKGPTWDDEKNAIYNFLCSCEWMMMNATITRLAPDLNEVPGTRLAPRLAPLVLAGLDADWPDADAFFQ